MKLCAYCESHILDSQQSWGTHHESYALLKHASNNRCLFCYTLQEDIATFAPGLKELGGENFWPVYRWSIRSLAKIRESLETVVVRFRPIPRPANGDENLELRTKAEDAEELPTRTFFFFPEEALKPLPTIEELGSSTDPAISGGHHIARWIEICNTTHPGCHKSRKGQSSSERFIPTRLLDISGPPESPIRVVETKLTPINGPYVSLSHCWGVKEFITLRTGTLDRFKTEGVPWDLFPKNFQEAIEVARFLNVGHIWIDSLCIIQGPDGDFKDEANKMHQVYRNSYCNIAIVDSMDSTGGVFRRREPKDVVPVRYQSETPSAMFGSKAWRVVSEHLWESELLQTFLYRRGWVFQERMLAPRILHFAHRQIFWDCPAMSACESLPGGLPQPMDGAAGTDRHWRGRLQESGQTHEPLTGANDDSLEFFWKTAVRKYTNCALTKGADKKIAMWGIAKLVRDEMGVAYGNGLWQQNLEDQLTWRVAKTTLELRPSESTAWNLERKIPSWSWASMDGEIVVPDFLLTDVPHFTVRDHYRRPLAFDLKGVKRCAPPPESERESPAYTRGMSDTNVQLQRRREELERERENEVDQQGQQRTRSPEKIDVDSDAEPEFYNESIQIQGHVGRGQLVWDDMKKKWLLKLDGLSGVEIEAFPDTKPKLKNPVDMEPYFVVLSAKKVNNPSNTPQRDKSGELHDIQEGDEYDSDNEPEGAIDEADILISGVGILLKDVGNYHFHRTGALRFREVDPNAWRRLQETHRSEGLPPDKYHALYGLKFWLD
ncbi:HET-domain-containing protein [Lindgomyces ingoldianus]|uniref:HET-domain-containing protein n=1 Tax=Lindgomyces ingoldianus TaxID=673940 RepID=A0ACB6QN17_9PLEO|nr:HET-domain-containing protein [Lindgomyces ingoldianus]KAF2468285.1 HET-domain-containing protein [Lindgomyces ingoldianus]